jgi:hypothetical protein
MATATEIQAYADVVQTLQDEDRYSKSTVSVQYGKKYARIVLENGSSKSVHSFVEIATGNILKSASWQTPAKGKRGSVHDLAAGGFNQYGANYLR